MPETQHQTHEERLLPLDRRLTRLLEVSGILANTRSIDELTRRTVELSREKLGFERIGIWFYDAPGEQITGTYGIDEQGQIRSERGCRLSISKLDAVVPDWERLDHVRRIPDVVLRNHRAEVVGQGERLWSQIWDGQRNIGYMTLDNLFSGQPFSEDDRRIIGLLVTTFGNIYVAKLREQQPVTTEQELRSAITERDEALRALHQDLRASELRFHSLAETMSAAIVIYQGNRNIYVNSAAERMTGYSRQELETKPFWDVVPPEDQDLIRQRGMARLAGETVPEKYETRIRTKDGQDKWVAYSASRIELNGQPAILGCAFDITALKHALRELEESREGFRILAEATYEGIAIHENGVLLQANDQFLEMFGYEPGELLGRQCMPLLIAPESLEAASERVRKKITGAYEIVFVRKDGSRFHAEALSRQWIYQNREVRVSILRDLTERKKQEEVLRHTQKMQTVGTLAGGMAHDFNNLLMTMGGHLDRLEGLLPENARCHEHLGLVRRAVCHAAGITRSLLTFSHGSPIRKKPTNLGDVCRDVSRLLSPLLSMDIERIWEIPDSPIVVKTDPCLIQQVLLNLLLNARDALPDGGEIHVSLREVQTTLGEPLPGQSPDQQDCGRYAELRIRDTGIGIKEKMLPRIFEPFVTTKSRKRGTGLGLAVTYTIVREHGGWIHVTSTPGQGSTFTVYLPADGTEESADALPVADGCRLDGMRILLVEDDEMVLALLGDSLTDAGAKVTTAKNAESAMGHVMDGLPRLDVAVVDHDLPGGSSQELFLKIRDRYPEAQRLILSGGVLDRSLLNWADQQEIPFLLKPFRLNDLSHLIHELVNRENAGKND